MRTLIIAILIVLSNISHAYGWVNYNAPVEGFTSEELRGKVMQCVSNRLGQMKTDNAVDLLEEICYYKVVNSN